MPLTSPPAGTRSLDAPTRGPGDPVQVPWVRRLAALENVTFRSLILSALPRFDPVLLLPAVAEASH